MNIKIIDKRIEKLFNALERMDNQERLNSIDVELMQAYSIQVQALSALRNSYIKQVEANRAE